MDPAYVLLGVLAVAIPLLVKEVREIRSQCYRNSERTVVLETKMDIFLEHQGFDVHKVNKAINEHIDELKQNNKPTVGCINRKELYQDKEM